MKKLLLLISCLCLCTIHYGQQVNIKDFGAKGDGIQDDLAAWDSAISYVLSFPQYQTPEIIVPAGVYRFTNTLIIGGYAIKAADCYVSAPVKKYSKTTKLNSREFQKGTRSASIKIVGVGTVSIYADFNDSSELKPVISYQAAGDTRNLTSTRQYTAEINNIGIYGKGSFTSGGKPILREKPDYRRNNQVGILAIYTHNIKLNQVLFWGLKEGLMLNNCYLMDIRNLKFEYCQRGIYEIQNHSGKLENIAAYFCDKGIEMRSNQLVTDVYYAHSCGIGLHVAASNNLFNSVYLESYNSGESQLIIGDNPGEPNASKNLLSGLAFNMLTIVALKANKSIGNGITWKDNARRMNVNGGVIQTCTFKYPAHKLVKVRYEGVTGNLPAAISTKLD
ncbi:MAG TPA: glycosyl hydrolase family 28-related protein [Ferruginibacter sp.]|nr:glycosyl hydrolase family 28-related protein [Ferruginibacter sp.]HPH89876.1 glycosyl hydrolase family 28-related protein [Ferruginibacter sp.]